MAEIISIVDDLDNSVPATKRRLFAVGRKRYTLDLGDGNAERFDAELAFWVKAAKRLSDEGDDTSADRTIVGRPLETIKPVPAKGKKWWMDPPRPFSRETGELFSSARHRVREWARGNGWPDLGERGVIPREAYDQWYDEVWSVMDKPSWSELTRLDSVGAKRKGASSRASASKNRTA